MMLKRYMHKRERHFAMLNDNRVVRPFEWGTEFIGGNVNGSDPREIFGEYSQNAVENSDEFFFKPAIRDYEIAYLSATAKDSQEGGLVPASVMWTSAIATPSPENNTAYATYFPHETNREAAVIVLPHWN